MSKVKVRLLVFAATLLLLGLSEGLHSRTSTGAGPGYKDPGVRTGTDDAGGSLPDLTPNEEILYLAVTRGNAVWRLPLMADRLARWRGHCSDRSTLDLPHR